MTQNLAQAYINAGLQPFPPLPVDHEFHVEHLIGFEHTMPDAMTEKYSFMFENTPGDFRFVAFVQKTNGDRYIELMSAHEAFITKPNDMVDIYQTFMNAWNSSDPAVRDGVSFIFQGVMAGGKRRKRSKKTRRHRKGSRKNYRFSK